MRDEVDYEYGDYGVAGTTIDICCRICTLSSGRVKRSARDCDDDKVYISSLDKAAAIMMRRQPELRAVCALARLIGTPHDEYIVFHLNICLPRIAGGK